MIQDILAYIIIIAAFVYVAYKFVAFFVNIKRKKSTCSACSSGSCSGCPIAGGLTFEQYNASKYKK
jgi:hypothetical protein